MSGASNHESGRDELVVDVRDIRHLFVAPDIDPLARYEGEVVGEAALLRIVRKLMATRELDRAYKLVVRLPGDRIDLGLEERTRVALSRYAAMRIADNEAQLAHRTPPTDFFSNWGWRFGLRRRHDAA